jgi:hypothetical protein
MRVSPGISCREKTAIKVHLIEDASLTLWKLVKIGGELLYHEKTRPVSTTVRMWDVSESAQHPLSR